MAVRLSLNKGEHGNDGFSISLANLMDLASTLLFQYVRCLGIHSPKPSKAINFPISNMFVSNGCVMGMFSFNTGPPIQKAPTFTNGEISSKLFFFCVVILLCMFTWILQPPGFKVLKSEVSRLPGLPMSFDSKLFSMETLEAGVDTLREQGVKVEMPSPDTRDLEKELEDLWVETQTTIFEVYNVKLPKYGW